MNRRQAEAALAKLSPEALAATIAEADRLLARKKLERYRPYPKQAEFHAAGAEYKERLFLAGNQLGKTWSGGFEFAMHLTGRYPDWWTGWRFDKPIQAWAAGPTSEKTRDNPQRILIGPPADQESWGTGSIPADAFVGRPSASRGMADAIDQMVVKHVSGGQSILGFNAYEKGRSKWQGDTLDLIWFDEEPPADIYSEGLTRTTATNGIVYITATPLLGMSEVVRKFYPEPETARRIYLMMAIEDAEHIPPERRQEEIDKYPAHEREARAKGIPMLGSGRIYPVAEEALMCEPFRVPRYFVQIGGWDFGWEHPTAAVKLAWDRDEDIIYVTGCYRQREQTPVIHAAAVKPWGDWLPWAWPHDADQHDKTSGEQLSKTYGNLGLKMLPHRACFEDGNNGVEAGLLEILDYMQAGRFKVFRHLAEWFDEFRTYHRQEGKIVKKFDDLMDATRYAYMMRRFAKPATLPAAARKPFSRATGYSVR